jgi:hypothetical protein
MLSGPLPIEIAEAIATRDVARGVYAARHKPIFAYRETR